MKNSTYQCKTCGKESKMSHQKRNVYCSNACAGQGKVLESIDRTKQGLVSDRATLRNVLSCVRGYKCEICGISDHNSLPITLQVDHVNGLANNNKLDNLRLLCPNCHSQTEFWGARNKGQGRAFLGLPLR
jgi:5-methylcytosine-specific restriction endonuclease McrA